MKPENERPPLNHIKRPRRVPLEQSEMGLRDFFRSAAAIFRLARKSDKAEFMLYLKLVTVGVVIVGVIGFVIKLVGNVFFG
jgi:protein translocase SEC61 complex gamma subunit